MALVEFELDREGIAEILRSPQMRDTVNAVAVKVAAKARGALPDKKARVVFRPYTTDRQTAGVAVLHRDAAQWEQERGLLTGAARALGLDVQENPASPD